MALITQYSDTNKQEYEPLTTYTVSIGYHALQGVWCQILNDITTGRYAYVGMTKTAALACQTAVHNPMAGINAQCRWVGGHMYEVEVSVFQIYEYQVPVEA